MMCTVTHDLKVVPVSGAANSTSASAASVILTLPKKKVWDLVLAVNYGDDLEARGMNVADNAGGEEDCE